MSKPQVERQKIFVLLDNHPDVQFLAHGAAADVWKAHQSHRIDPSSACVHKVLRVDQLCSGPAILGKETHDKLWQDFLEDYHSKVDRWRSFTNDNVVRVLGLGDGLNLSVEFCEGGSVREYLRTGSQSLRSYPNKLAIISDVLQGLQYLHTCDPPVAHGNINAGKLFIDEQGTTKIGEFGLAALCYPFAALVPSVSLDGLSRWLSPELLDADLDDGIIPTIASDIWALGCVLFEIVAETTPYPNCRHDMQVQRSILRQEYPGQQNERFGYWPFNQVWPLIEACWQMRPEDRYSASKLIEVFAQVASGVQIRTRPNGSMSPSALATTPAPDSCKLVGGESSDPSEQFSCAQSSLGDVASVLSAWAKLDAWLRGVDQITDLYKFLRLMVDGLSKWVTVYEAAANELTEGQELCDGLSEAFQGILGYLVEPIIPTMTDDIQQIIRGLVESIEREASAETPRVVEFSRTVLQSLKQLEFHLSRSMWKTMVTQSGEPHIPSRAVVVDAWYTSRYIWFLGRWKCAPNTSQEVTERLDDWLLSREKVFCLGGPIGTGKTTVAHTLCGRLHASRRLGASFFCSRLLPQCRNMALIIPVISHQLSRFSASFRSHRARALEDDPDIQTRGPHEQFAKLIAQPLKAAPDMPDNLVVVIDALDECEDRNSTLIILKTLFAHLPDPSIQLKFLITSREWPDVSAALRSPYLTYGHLYSYVLRQRTTQNVQQDSEPPLASATSALTQMPHYPPFLDSPLQLEADPFRISVAPVLLPHQGAFFGNRSRSLEVDARSTEFDYALRSSAGWPPEPYLTDGNPCLPPPQPPILNDTTFSHPFSAFRRPPSIWALPESPVGDGHPTGEPKDPLFNPFISTYIQDPSASQFGTSASTSPTLLPGDVLRQWPHLPAPDHPRIGNPFGPLIPQSPSNSGSDVQSPYFRYQSRSNTPATSIDGSLTSDLDEGGVGPRRRSGSGSHRTSPYHRLSYSPRMLPWNDSASESYGSIQLTKPVEQVHVVTPASSEASSSRRTLQANFKCPVPGCGSTFTRHFNLRGHLRSHNEERPFKCKWPGCGKGFARQHDCKRHEALHLNLRPYTCEGCQKTFARMDAFNRHLKSEGGIECQKVQSELTETHPPENDNKTDEQPGLSNPVV